MVLPRQEDQNTLVQQLNEQRFFRLEDLMEESRQSHVRAMQKVIEQLRE